MARDTDGHGLNTVAVARDWASMTATIVNGESLSDAVRIEGLAMISLQMPSAWTAAGLTFQGSGDGVTFGDVYDDAGAEVAVIAANVAVSRVIVDATVLEKLAGLAWIKVRSGTSGVPVAQGGDRSIVVIAKG